MSASDLTYIPNLDAECLRVFKETYKEIALNGDITGKTKQKQEKRIQELETELQAVRTVMLGLFGLNRKQVEASVIKQMEKDGIASHTGMTPKDYVKDLTLEQLLKEFEMVLKKQEA